MSWPGGASRRGNPFRDEGDPSSVPGKPGVSAPFIGAFDSAKRADRADRRGIWRPGGTDLVNFIKLLCEKNLLREFGGCQEAFQRRYYAAHNIAEAVVTSAASLSKEQEELLKKKLETMSGKTVVMELKTDPSVLAGVRVELDGKLFDGTVKGRLSELSRRISDTVV